MTASLAVTRPYQFARTRTRGTSATFEMHSKFLQAARTGLRSNDISFLSYVLRSVLEHVAHLMMTVKELKPSRMELISNHAMPFSANVRE